MAFYTVTHKYSRGQYFDSIVFKNPTNKEIMEVFSKGELLRKTEELYDYKYFKYIYTNNDHFYVWSSPIHHRTVREEVIYKEEKVKWTAEGRVGFISQRIIDLEKGRIICTQAKKLLFQGKE